jgi:hypothetical protein
MTDADEVAADIGPEHVAVITGNQRGSSPFLARMRQT